MGSTSMAYGQLQFKTHLPIFQGSHCWLKTWGVWTQHMYCIHILFTHVDMYHINTYIYIYTYPWNAHNPKPAVACNFTRKCWRQFDFGRRLDRKLVTQPAQLAAPGPLGRCQCHDRGAAKLGVKKIFFGKWIHILKRWNIFAGPALLQWMNSSWGWNS